MNQVGMVWAELIWLRIGPEEGSCEHGDTYSMNTLTAMGLDGIRRRGRSRKVRRV
jgi:hypothetical protein